MTFEQELLGVDLALLSTASRYDLTEHADCRRSNRALVRLFDRLAKAAEPDLVLEIGAFHGEFSRRMRAALPAATVVAFEANPHNYAAIAPGFEGSGIDYRFTAVGNSVGAAVMNIARKHPPVRGSHSLLLKTQKNVRYDRVEVPLTTVDEFVSSLPATAGSIVMWIDVEGLGHEVLTGASKTLPETNLIFLEVEDKPYWEGQKLSGDVTRLLWERGLVPIARDFASIAQYNVIYCRRHLMDYPLIREALCYFYGKAPLDG